MSLIDDVNAANFNEQRKAAIQTNWQTAIDLWRNSSLQEFFAFMQEQTGQAHAMPAGASEALIQRVKERVLKTFMRAADERGLSNENIFLIGAALCTALDDFTVEAKK